MVNHLYSLLLNARRPSNVIPAPPWERYISEDFVTARFPPWLEKVRQAMIPYTSWWDMTYRAEEIMSVLLEPRYKDYTLSLDPRITTPDVAPFLFNFSTTVAGINELAKSQQAYVLTKTARTFVPLIRRVWTITFPGNGTLVASSTNEERTYDYDNAGVFIDPDVGIQVENPLAGAIFRLTAYRQPTGGLVDTFTAVKTLPDVTRVQLFISDVRNEQLTLNDYRMWYETSQYDSDKLAAVALAYQIHATKYL